MSTSQTQKAAWEEGVAIQLLREVNDPEPPISAIGVAQAFGLEVRYGPGTKGRIDHGAGVIFVPGKVRATRADAIVAHELGHFGSKRYGAEDTEESASYIGSAIKLPRKPFMRDMAETNWDIRALCAKHIYCSAELVARRICTLDDAVVAIWDNGTFKNRWPSPWLPDALRGRWPSQFERDLADRVLESQSTIREGERLWGFPITEGRYRRVITVCAAEQLGMRF